MKFTNKKYPFIESLYNQRFSDMNWNKTEINSVFNIELIASRWDFKHTELQTASRPMLDKGVELFGDDLYSFYKKLKPCSGMLLASNGIGYLYDISPNEERNCIILCFGNNELVGTLITDLSLSEDNRIRMQEGKSIPSIKANWSNILWPVMILNMIVQFAKTEVTIIGGGQPRSATIDGIKYLSELNIPVKHYDSSWFREIIRTSEFGVRPHFRLQPYGEGRKQYKLILISAYKKHGYHRRAKKDLINK